MEDNYAVLMTKLEALAEDVSDIKQSLLGNGKPETGLAWKFADHCKSPHVFELSKKRTFWMIFALTVVFGHALLEVSSPWVMVLAKMAGVPLP